MFKKIFVAIAATAAMLFTVAASAQTPIAPPKKSNDALTPAGQPAVAQDPPNIGKSPKDSTSSPAEAVPSNVEDAHRKTDDVHRKARVAEQTAAFHAKQIDAIIASMKARHDEWKPGVRDLQKEKLTLEEFKRLLPLVKKFADELVSMEGEIKENGMAYRRSLEAATIAFNNLVPMWDSFAKNESDPSLKESYGSLAKKWGGIAGEMTKRSEALEKDSVKIQQQMVFVNRSRLFITRLEQAVTLLDDTTRNGEAIDKMLGDLRKYADSFEGVITGFKGLADRIQTSPNPNPNGPPKDKSDPMSRIQPTRLTPPEAIRITSTKPPVVPRDPVAGADPRPASEVARGPQHDTPQVAKDANGNNLRGVVTHVRGEVALADTSRLAYAFEIRDIAFIERAGKVVGSLCVTVIEGGYVGGHLVDGTAAPGDLLLFGQAGRF